MLGHSGPFQESGHFCACVSVCPSSREQRVIRPFSRKSGRGENDAFLSPFFSSSDEPTLKILQGSSVEDLTQRYQES